MVRGREQIQSEIDDLIAQADAASARADYLRSVAADRGAELMSGRSPSVFPFADYEWEHWQLNPNDRPTIPKALAFSGVYIWLGDEGQFLYVGESGCIATRLKDHFKLDTWARESVFIYMKTHQRIAPPRMLIARMDTLRERLMCEEAAISFGKPAYNVARHGLWRPE